MTEPAKTREKMTCAEFQNELPFLMERGDDAALENHPHLKECEKCSDLVRDLRYIADQAKLLLPLHDPSPRVWNNIEDSLKKEGYSSSGGNSGPANGNGSSSTKDKGNLKKLGLAILLAVLLLGGLAFFFSSQDAGVQANQHGENHSLVSNPFHASSLRAS